MNVFHTHSRIVEDYATYIRSFLNIADPAIRGVVEGELEKGKLWPEPQKGFSHGIRDNHTRGKVSDFLAEKIAAGSQDFLIARENARRV